MTVPNFMSKGGSYQDLGRGGGALCVPSRGMTRQKYPGAARVKICMIQFLKDRMSSISSGVYEEN